MMHFWQARCKYLLACWHPFRRWRLLSDKTLSLTWSTTVYLRHRKPWNATPKELRNVRVKNHERLPSNCSLCWHEMFQKALITSLIISKSSTWTQAGEPIRKQTGNSALQSMKRVQPVMSALKTSAAFATWTPWTNNFSWSQASVTTSCLSATLTTTKTKMRTICSCSGKLFSRASSCRRRCMWVRKPTATRLKTGKVNQSMSSSRWTLKNT